MCLIWLFALAKAENEKAQTFGQPFLHAAKAEHVSPLPVSGTSMYWTSPAIRTKIPSVRTSPLAPSLCCAMFSPCSLSSPTFLSYCKFISQYNVARHLLLLLFSFSFFLSYKPILSSPCSLYSSHVYLYMRAWLCLALSSPLGNWICTLRTRKCELSLV